MHQFLITTIVSIGHIFVMDGLKKLWLTVANAAWFHYNLVNVLQNTHSRHSIDDLRLRDNGYLLWVLTLICVSKTILNAAQYNILFYIIHVVEAWGLCLMPQAAYTNWSPHSLSPTLLYRNLLMIYQQCSCHGLVPTSQIIISTMMTQFTLSMGYCANHR